MKTNEKADLSAGAWSLELFALAYALGAGVPFEERRVVLITSHEPPRAGFFRGLWNRFGFRACYLAGKTRAVITKTGVSRSMLRWTCHTLGIVFWIAAMLLYVRG